MEFQALAAILPAIILKLSKKHFPGGVGLDGRLGFLEESPRETEVLMLYDGAEVLVEWFDS